MTDEEYYLVRSKIALSDWQEPMLQPVHIRKAMIDLHDCLPNKNIEAWVVDNTIAPYWGSVTDDDSGKRNYFLIQSPSMWTWWTLVTIDCDDWLDAEAKGALQSLVDDETELAIQSLIDLVTPAFDYKSRKSDAEIEVMRAKFEDVKNNPPAMSKE